MAREHIVVGLDIGTHYIYTVVGTFSPDVPLPQIIGMGRIRSYGIRKGMIIDIDDVVEGIGKSIRDAEQSSGVSISKVFMGIGGNHIVSLPSRGVVAVSRADGEISDEDIARVMTAAQTVALPPNREILHTIPTEYIIDGDSGLQDVVGMNGLRLETNALIIGGSTGHLRNITRAAGENDLEVEGLVLSSLAASKAVLSKRQKELGVLCLDIGGGTTDMAIFEEGKLISANVLPIGGDNITNDLAIGLRCGVETAERVKREYGLARAVDITRRDTIDLSKFDPNETETILRKDVVEIMEARLNEIFDIVNKELKRAGKEAFLPGGVVLVGGTAKIPHIVDLCKAKLRLPVQIGFPRDVEGIVASVDDPSYATALGLVFSALEERGDRFSRVSIPRIASVNDSVDKMKKWMRAFMP